MLGQQNLAPSGISSQLDWQRRTPSVRGEITMTAINTSLVREASMLTDAGSETRWLTDNLASLIWKAPLRSTIPSSRWEPQRSRLTTWPTGEGRTPSQKYEDTCSASVASMFVYIVCGKSWGATLKARTRRSPRSAHTPAASQDYY